MFAWLREIGLRLLSTLGLYNKKATVILLGEFEQVVDAVAANIPSSFAKNKEGRRRSRACAPACWRSRGLGIVASLETIKEWIRTCCLASGDVFACFGVRLRHWHGDYGGRSSWERLAYSTTRGTGEEHVVRYVAPVDTTS